MIRRVWQLIAPAVWAPLLVFVVHVVLDRGLGIYGARPWVDIPMHFAGGLADSKLGAKMHAVSKSGYATTRNIRTVRTLLERLA